MLSIKNHQNLNQLSHNSALEIAKKAFKKGFKITHIYVDVVGEAGKYKLFLRAGLKDY